MLNRIMVQEKRFSDWHNTTVGGESIFDTAAAAMAAIERAYPNLDVESRLRLVEVTLAPVTGVIVSGPDYGTRLDFRAPARPAAAEGAPTEHA